MKLTKRFFGGGLLLMACVLTACQAKRPDTVLSDAKMEDVLYDYHIAKAMGEEVSHTERYKRVLYIESVYKKHGITEAQFDSSMVWFARHPDVITQIYEKVNERLKAERSYIEHLVALRENKPITSLPGDSIDVWAWLRIYQLSGMPMDNKMTFTLPSDSNFKERDTLRWSVSFAFSGEAFDTLHAPIMAMQIHYKNDSVIGTSVPIYQPGVQTLTLAGDTLGALSEVKGFVYYPRPHASRPLLLHRISLMRYHAREKDSLDVADSLDTEAPQETPVGKSRKDSIPVTPKVEKDSVTPPKTPARPRPEEIRRSQKPATQSTPKPVIRKSNVHPLKPAPSKGVQKKES